jgi:hypothetical protein
MNMSFGAEGSDASHRIFFVIYLTIIILIFFAIFIPFIYKASCHRSSKSTEPFIAEQSGSAGTERSSDNLLVWGWAINKDRKKMEEMSSRFLESGKLWGYKTELIGIGWDYAKWDAPVVNGDGSNAGHGLQRFYVLREALEKIKDPNQIIVVMDTADTLFSGPPEEVLKNFKDLNTRLLISAEEAFTYQYPTYRPNYDHNNKYNIYKYINAGTYMGYAYMLKKMVDECIVMCCESDKDGHSYDKVEMTVLANWTYRYLIPTEPPGGLANVRLDTMCKIFWVTTGDRDKNFEKELDKPGRFFNPITKTNPQILHIMPPDRKMKFEKGLEKIKRSLLKFNK